ncbi:divalent metal cation transporter [Haloferula sp. A504]|uniref:divalent metal cation transporter n=1 Tax=Haloferula sp. A504 TaxID=3373601 RepID=UPI0031BF4232|nr:divalent metal cation transporter [Verrucomicrobiaceae bacterium E54]
MSDPTSKEPADMSVNSQIEEHRQIILDGEAKGGASKFLAYARLSGPGWLQSAITLGGGSLANALYLGVLGGVAFMWLQPMAMMFGIVMMSAIAYITLSTGKRPLRSINQHISPILGWGWLAASMMANIVWSLPQFALAVAALRQNLLPGVLGAESGLSEFSGMLIAAVIVLALVITNVMIYISGGKGTKVFEIIMKVMVGTIVICFFGVVIQLSVAGQIDWGAIGAGLIPSFESLFTPAPTFAPYLDQLSEGGRQFWSDLIVGQQRDVMIGAAATAVGINMTFLLPYSMLRKGWNRDFRGMAIFDLSTGLFIPFMLATGCVVISAASQFHAQPAPGLVSEFNAQGEKVEPAANLVGPYKGLLAKRMLANMDSADRAAFEELSKDDQKAKLKEMGETGTEALPLEERTMAAMLVKRDAFNLAQTLEPLVGKKVANYVFGFGVLGMALNAATMLMLINGLCFCELRNRAPKGWTQRFGSLMVCVGVLGPFFWKGDAQMWLAVPTSVFAMVLLPIAYVVFALMMNNKTILGKDMPGGRKRIVWNVLMAGACTFAAIGSLWSLWSKLGWIGLVLFALFIVVVITTRKKVTPAPAPVIN